ncbi:MAG: DUF6390 family protein [Candidatus Daviesbacteria bacterium]|nr:DUF6390 family protein [Candidatus Daviesbacteria bacterium]
MIKPQMDIKALQLGSRFSISPNSLGYCGRKSAITVTENCVINNVCDKVEEEFSNFIGLNPYLETLSKVLNSSKSSYEVIEGYWLGNDNLKKASIGDYEILLANFLKQGIPEFFVKELENKKPKQFIPFHLFQVLHVGVGKVSGSVPFNLETINQCMIRWGKVTKINKNLATIKLNSLKSEKDKYSLIFIEDQFPINQDFTPSLKVGDTVAVHWKMIAKILTKKEESNLSFWTKEVLKGF